MLNRVKEKFQPVENRRCAGGNGVREWQQNCRVWGRERSRDLRTKGRDEGIQVGI